MRGGHETQLRVFRAVTAFLREVAEESPLVLLLDDLHWADATSLSLLLYLGRHLEGSRILLLGTYRDAEVGREHPLDETLRELVRERLVDEVHIQPLSVAETGGLIRQQLAGQAVSDDLVATVHARAEGNPFFTEELLKALVEQGGLSQGQARWDRLESIDVPRGVRSLVVHRVSRLPSETQQLLRVASVIRQEVDPEVLVGVIGQPEAAVINAVATALATGLLKEARRGGRTRYAFVHALVQQALYAELPSSQRRRLHGRIGEVFELMQPVRPLVAADLARHFLAARDTERAVGYALQAGREASSRYAHAEAARWYQEAVDLLLERGEHAQAAEAQSRLAGELYDLNHLAEALAAYHAALDTFEDLADTLGQARVHWGIGLVHRGRYDLVSAAPHVEAALRLWPPDHQDSELASLQVDAARASVFKGDFAAAGSMAARAVAVAERCEDPGLLAQSLVVLALVRERDDPRPRATIELLDRAERVVRAAGDWRAMSLHSRKPTACSSERVLSRPHRVQLSGEPSLTA
jgi:predicted ATPase